jgi:hypothetical protein
MRNNEKWKKHGKKLIQSVADFVTKKIVGVKEMHVSWR